MARARTSLAPRAYLKDDDAPAKREILIAALRLFVRDGLCETSIRDIAEATGYTNPALFKHFASKHELALHLFEHCYLALFAAVHEAVGSAEAFAPRHRALIAAYLTALEADRDAVLYVQDNLRHFWPSVSTRVRRSSIVMIVHDMLQDGRREGVVTDTLSIELLGVAYLGVLQQFGRAWYFGDFKGPAVQHAEHLGRLLLRMTAIGGRS